MDLRKGLLWTGIGAISTSGLIAAAIVLFGSFDELQMRIIVSTMTLGWYCLTASLTFGFDEKGLAKLAFMPYLGLLVSGVASLMTFNLIWSNDFKWLESTGYIKTVLILFVLSFVLANVSILLKTLSAHILANIVAVGTSCIIGMIGAILIFWILDDFKPYILR